MRTKVFSVNITKRSQARQREMSQLQMSFIDFLEKIDCEVLVPLTAYAKSPQGYGLVNHILYSTDLLGLLQSC
jgi:hypothetical protein